MSGRRVAVAALALAALGAFWALRAPAPLTGPRFAPADCRRVAVSTPDGRPLSGIEDMAALPDGRLLLSAHDRLGGEGPAGLFAFDPDGPPVAAPLAGLPTGARPHGIALAPDGRLAFVNRIEGGAEIVSGRLESGGFALASRASGDALCRANDLAFAAEGLVATLDRGACGIALADLLPGAATGRVVRIADAGAPEVLTEGLSFPNGIAPRPGALAVAETRARRIRWNGGAIPTPGGPDNLSLAPDGRIVAALHPNLLRLALRRAGAPVPAPTRIVAVSPDAGRVEPLLDDPAGDLFNGASVGILSGGRLYAGAAYDSGLLVCGAAP